jgi:hypothetical protein
MCWWLVVVLVTTSVGVTRIYREDPPRVTTFRNQLGLSPSKRIRHKLVAKINSKRRPRTYEALSQILVNYSHAHRAPVPITSSHPTSPRPAPMRQGERARVYISVTPPPTTTRLGGVTTLQDNNKTKIIENIGINLKDQSKRKQLPTFNLNQRV